METDHLLLPFGGEVDARRLVAAARDRNMPLGTRDMVGRQTPDAYRHAMMSVRPDRHVAWRGDCLPDDTASLVDQLAGARILAPIA